MSKWSELVDLEHRTVSPRAFTDPEVYRAEQERIFARCWLFVAHESQIPKPGDFVTNHMGDESVIICRDGDGRVRVLINSCRHRGMRVCRTDTGNTRTFQCPYHGWTYDVKGRLVGVPQYQEAYHNELKREEWGLLEVPKVDSYRGLIFASFDREAESLDTYLGEMKWYLDVMFDRTAGGWMMLPGVHKWTLKGNWKLAAEQFGGDNYHVMAGHESMARLGLFPAGKTAGDEPWTRDFEARLDNGHGWISLAIPDPSHVTKVLGPYLTRVRAEAKQRSQPSALAHFDEDKVSLTMRVQRIRTGAAHADEPPARVRHLVSNVRIVDADDETANVTSNFIVFKSRRGRDESLFVGCREDRWQQIDGAWKLEKRLIVLDHDVIENVTVFF